MTYYFLLIFAGITVFGLNSLYIIGLNTVTYYEENDDDSKMIFWKVREWSVETFGKFWSKPICTCPPCMASLHSTYIYFPVALSIFGAIPVVFLAWPVYALALSGFVKLINS